MGSSTRIGELFKTVDVSAALRRVFVVAGVVLLIAIAWFIALQSPFNPDSIRYPGAAASRFYYIGSQIPEGIMPYRDAFDYHGPLIFLINALGSFLNGPVGVWWLEIAFLAATLITVFVTLNRCVGIAASFIVCILFAGLVAYSMEGGNSVEEYGLLFQALGMAGFVDYCVRRQLTLASVYLIGTSAALAFCLRPIMVVFWVPFFLVVVVMLFYREGAVVGFTRTLSLLLSVLPTFVIIIPWLSMNNALTSCYDQVNLFYQDYLTLITQQQQLDTLQYFASSTPFVLIVLISVAASIKLLHLKYKLRSKAGADGRGAASLVDGGGAASMAASTFATETAPVAGAVPADAPGVTAAAADDPVPADDSAPTDDPGAAAAADDPAPADDEAPADDPAPADDEAPADDSAPTDDPDAAAAAADDEAPADDPAPADDSAPADDDDQVTPKKARQRLFFGLPAAPPLVIRENPLMQHTEPFGSDTLLLILTNLVTTCIAVAAMAAPGSMNEPVVLHGLICLLIPLAFVINLAVKSVSDRAPLKIVFGLVLVVLLGLSFSAPGVTATITRAQEQQTSSPELVDQQELVAALAKWQQDDEPTIIFGDECWIYSAVDSYSATRYAWQPFDEVFRPDLYADFYRQVGVADARLLIGRSD
ncbi:MAG: hypothetical protein LBU31_02300, partial [Coriobacteriales bacterium]|nr:hypothetical protein [Coriobacteriales bacterium]